MKISHIFLFPALLGFLVSCGNTEKSSSLDDLTKRIARIQTGFGMSDEDLEKSLKRWCEVTELMKDLDSILPRIMICDLGRTGN